MTAIIGRLILSAVIALSLALPVHAKRYGGSASAPPLITISGKAFLKDGVPWRAKGVIIGAFLASPGHLDPTWRLARAAWGRAELMRLRRIFGIDTVRFHASEPALDPQHALYDPGYLGDLLEAVRLARALHFVVIVDMQWESPTGALMPCKPGAEAVRAWQTLAPRLAGDGGVLIEPFNEPCHDAADITGWAVDMQALITAIRAGGAGNILLIDGRDYGKYISSSWTPLTDTLANSMALAFHPFFGVNGFNTTPEWDNAFGGVAASHPIIATAWQGTPWDACTPSLPTVAASLLAYLNGLGAAGVGLIEWAGDRVGTVVADLTTGTPTDYSTFTACGDGSVSGAGALFQAWTP